MTNGNTNEITEAAERAVRQMAACGLSHSAKDILTLIRYTKALEKNQKAFIDLTLRQQKLLKKQEKIIDVCDVVLTIKQKRRISEWLKEMRKYDPPRTD